MHLLGMWWQEFLEVIFSQGNVQKLPGFLCSFFPWCPAAETWRAIVFLCKTCGMPFLLTQALEGPVKVFSLIVSGVTCTHLQGSVSYPE